MTLNYPKLDTLAETPTRSVCRFGFVQVGSYPLICFHLDVSRQTVELITDPLGGADLDRNTVLNCDPHGELSSPRLIVRKRCLSSTTQG